MAFGARHDLGRPFARGRGPPGGMDRQTLRDWVLRYNELGADGLVSRAAPGPATKLSDAQMQALRALVISGPDPAIHKVVR